MKALIKHKIIILFFLLTKGFSFSQDFTAKDSIAIKNAEVGDYVSISRCESCKYIKTGNYEITLMKGFDSTLLNKQMNLRQISSTTKTTRPSMNDIHYNLQSDIGDERIVRNIPHNKTYTYSYVSFSNTNTSISYSNFNVLGEYFKTSEETKRKFNLHKNLKMASFTCGLLFLGGAISGTNEFLLTENARNKGVLIAGIGLLAGIVIQIPLNKNNFKGVLNSYNSSF